MNDPAHLLLEGDAGPIVRLPDGRLFLAFSHGNLMSEALSCAIEACMGAADRRPLLERGVEILRTRRAERETVVRANWRLVGRG